METIRVNIPRPSYLDVNGIKLHVMQAGDRDGDPVMLLHGFPEFWYGWHNQITPLAEAGYRVIIPDQRGYNLSSKPVGVEAYRIETLVSDVLGIMDSLGYDKVRLVGHDWGAVVAWFVALLHPERLEQLAIANVPHPLIFSQTLRRDVRQMFRSVYGGIFQIPLLPEQALQMGDYATLTNLLKSVPSLQERELRVYQQAWSQDKALTGMLNWYRAYVQYPPKLNGNQRVTVPTLMLWGMNDPALISEMAEASIELCDEGKLVLFKDASHFVQHDKAERVNELLLDFFANGINQDSPKTQADLP
ncbi:MAG: alpha/beta fold hydrolase [Phototrophicaceae bacterium]